MIVTVEVIRAIRLPAGATLDGAVMAEQTWVMPSKKRHDIDHALMVEQGWADKGYVSPEKLDGQPFVWGACC